MTDLITAEEAKKLAHKYRFANNDLERVLCETARTVIALRDQLADAKAAQAMVVERAVGVAKRHRSKVQINEHLWHDGQDWASDRIAEAIEALADTDGMALVQALRAERDEAKRLMQMRHREMLAADELMRKHQGRAVAAEADRDRLAAANAALEAQVGARRAERDQLRAAVEGLIAVLDRNGEKGPIPDVEMMFCWLAAQNVRAAFRNTEGRGDMTDDEALETLSAMANVQDGYAKKATDRGLKIIHKANAKAQREVAATINDLRARLASAEADRDRLAAANAVLEAKVAGLDEHRASAMLRRDMNAPEDPHVEALCERYGYGAVMDAASRLWARKDSMGAFYIGGCIGFKSDEEARAALATQEAGT